MALDSPVTLEQKDNSVWTREQRILEAVRHMLRTGQPLSRPDTVELINILTDIDDYAKGTATAVNVIKTNYDTWKAKPKK